MMFFYEIGQDPKIIQRENRHKIIKSLQKSKVEGFNS